MAATITAPLAPLTTIFTPSCSTSWLLTSSKDPSQFPPFPTGGPAFCDPPFWASNIADKGFQYYSPAICPSGFEVGPGCQVTETRTAEGFPVVEPDETAAYCVPSGFTCTTDTTDFRGGVWGATKEAGPPLFTVGPALQIRFQESDLSILETHPLTPGLTLAGLPARASVSASASAGPAGSISATATFGRFTMIPSPTPPPFVGTPSPTISETSRVGSPAAPSNMTTLSNASSTATVLPSNANTIDSKGQSSTSIAAIVLSTLLSLLAISFFIYACFKGRHGRGWRVSTNRRRKGLKAVGVGVWIGTRGSDDYDEEEPYEQQRTANTSRSSTPDSPPPRLSLPPEIRSSPPLGRLTLPRGWSPPENEGGIRIPIFRQGQDNNRQVKVPGAELDDSTPSRHGSWVSRVSRMLSRAARSSTTSRSSSRSRSRSAWGGAPSSSRRPPSEEWDHFFQGSLTVPHLTYSRPSSMASFASFPGDRKDDYYFDLEGAARRLPKIDSFDRLSEGTFGLRGRSRDRSAKRKS
ncbi:hypothetical protein KVR01_005886 [Diaporthe batatas]|uniref:uncharacterized protein n=1 Tax=Diaporthe batatas TaxID=748121 RepID=UPI001D03EA87|nr:uncharacterized protein KVR01_005886 [Diaporthe batatas]KAG8163968.1 hypothetical protein KVR01_005886 [Diaporthe batatas]